MRSVFSDFQTVTKLTETEFRNFIKQIVYYFCSAGKAMANMPSPLLNLGVGIF